MSDPVSNAELVALLALIEARAASLRYGIVNNHLMLEEIRQRQAELLRLQKRASEY